MDGGLSLLDRAKDLLLELLCRLQDQGDGLVKIAPLQHSCIVEKP